MALERATLTNVETGASFDVLFNPTEYSLSKDNAFAQAAVPGLTSPLLQFVHGSLQSLEMELFFDTYEQHGQGAGATAAQSDVRNVTDQIVALMAINAATHAPPRVVFHWASLRFTGVIAHVSQRFTMFLDSGIPVRALLQVTFSEWVDPAVEAMAVKRETATYTSVHVVGGGETLSAIAQTEYDDPRKWRPIAVANQLEDPRRLTPGLALAIPPLPYRNPVTGDVYQ